MIKFLIEPALIINKTLVIGDMHLGIEYEIFKSGISIPSQIEKIRKRIDRLILENNVNQLVFIGDVKHAIPVASFQEIRELPDFLKHFSDKLRVIIIKGNHDGDIEKFAPENVKIYSGAGFRYKNFGLAHGQSWINPSLLDAEYLILGHDHPAVEFWSSGFRIVEHCWLRCKIDKKVLEKKYKRKCKIKEAIVMPVFNHLVGGMAFNKKDFTPLGPLFKAIKWKESDVYLLDGTFLGSLKNLMEK